jgi:hypothetical protein
MIKFLHNLALFCVKNANFFAEFFGENILKIITSVPGHPAKSPLCNRQQMATLRPIFSTHFVRKLEIAPTTCGCGAVIIMASE